MTERRQRPICYGCDKKPAKKLNLPNSFGEIAIYCSMRCAAIDAIERAICVELTWCSIHRNWYVAEDLCYECDFEDRSDFSD